MGRVLVPAVNGDVCSRTSAAPAAAVAEHRRLPRLGLPALAAVAALLSAGCSTLSAPTSATGSAGAGGQRPSLAASGQPPAAGGAIQLLEQLPVRGRAPLTGYSREQFGDGWAQVDGCDVRDRVLAQQLTGVRFAPAGGGRCTVAEGTLADPYVPRTIHFVRGGRYDSSVDLDHVVPLGDAWQTGAQQLTSQRRVQFANDPGNLLAVDPSANRQKGDSDAATWLPRNTAFRCTYVVTQIRVKAAYTLWVTGAEKAALRRELDKCPAGAAGQASR